MIGILYIATGKYKIFFKQFYDSVVDKFIPNHEKKFFVFTDDVDYFSDFKNITTIKVDYNSFPLDSLLRFRFFNKIKNILLRCNYLVFMNANLIVNQKIDFDEFFVNNQVNNFWVVNHPGWYNMNPETFPYERRESLAQIDFGKGRFYLQACLFAGNSVDFMMMSEYIDILIMEDLKNNFIALWHDESYLNKFFLETLAYVHHPGFAYPENWTIPFEKCIIQLDKKKYFNYGH